MSNAPAVIMATLAVSLAGMLLTSLMLPGMWLTLAVALAYAILGNPAPDWITIGIACAVVGGTEIAFYLAPTRWRGSLSDERSVSLGAMGGAALGGVFTLLQPLWVLLVMVAAGGLAGAVAVEARLPHDLSEDDDQEKALGPGAVARRVAFLWLRTALAASLAAWTVHGVLSGMRTHARRGDPRLLQVLAPQP